MTYATELAQQDPVAAQSFPTRLKSEPLATRIADVIVEMSVVGAEGALWPTLLALDPRTARGAIEEIAYLYLEITRRSAEALLDTTLVSSSAREALNERLQTEVASQLWERCAPETDRAAYVRVFMGCWEERRVQYQGCARLYRNGNEPLQGTAIFAFYERLAELGHEVALLALANVQVPILHVELSKSFAEAVCEALGMEL